MRSGEGRNKVLHSIKEGDPDGRYAAKVLVPTEDRRINYRKKSKNDDIEEKNNEAGTLSHKRMAQFNSGTIKEKIQFSRYGMKSTENLQRNQCTTCGQSKLTKAPSRENLIGHSANVPIHVYICEALKMPTFGENNCFVTLATGHQSYVRIHLFRNRSNKKEHCRNFNSRMKGHLQHRVKRFLADNAPEFFAL